jgi:O-methyltransferase
MSSSAALPKLNSVLRIPWYGFWKFLETKIFQGSEYCVQVPSGRRVYTPWFQMDEASDFGQALKSIRQVDGGCLTPDASFMLYQLARHAIQLPGHVAECGVFRGASAQLLSWIINSHREQGTQLHLFDTFTGTPATTVPDRDHDQPGYFGNTSLDMVKQRLRQYSRFCHYHPGLVPDTFSEVADVNSYTFVHVDVDIYPAVLECCKWFWPRMAAGGVMVFNTYGAFPYRYATRAAVDEYFSTQPDKPLILPTAQAVVIKTGSSA